MQLGFDEKLHRYFDKSTNETYISATQFIEMFHQKFEEVEEYWLFYKAIQYASNIDKLEKIKKFDAKLNREIEDFLKLFYGQNYIFEEDQGSAILKKYLFVFKHKLNSFKETLNKSNLDLLEKICFMIKDHWLNENKKSTVKGTDFHNFMEGKQYEEGKFRFNNDFFLIDEDYTDIFNLKSGKCYPELKLFNKKYRIAGTSDQVLITPENKVIIRDWKTNKEIKTSNKYQKMFYPIEHLDDCEYVKYSLQLSLYAFMLEELGYEIQEIEFEHFVLNSDNREVSSTVYKCPYLREEIINMLEFYNKIRDLI